MSTDEQNALSEIVDQFLEQWCDIGTDLSALEVSLFKKFRVFWADATHEWIHNAPLSEFHVEMERRGYHFIKMRKRYWHGLALRRSKRPTSLYNKR